MLVLNYSPDQAQVQVLTAKYIVMGSVIFFKKNTATSMYHLAIWATYIICSVKEIDCAWLLCSCVGEGDRIAVPDIRTARTALPLCPWRWTLFQRRWEGGRAIYLLCPAMSPSPHPPLSGTGAWSRAAPHSGAECVTVLPLWRCSSARPVLCSVL